MQGNLIMAECTELNGEVAVICHPFDWLAPPSSQCPQDARRRQPNQDRLGARLARHLRACRLFVVYGTFQEI